MKLAILSALVASAAAFAPASGSVKSTALNADVKNQVGAQIPIGYFE